jgi:glutaminase
VAIYRCYSSGVDCRASLAMTECALAMTGRALATTGRTLATTGRALAMTGGALAITELARGEVRLPVIVITASCYREAAGCGGLCPLSVVARP